MKANKLILAWKSIKAFAKRNAFSCACFLLALVVLVTGSVSYAKYVNGNSQDGSASAGSFSASATIDSVTALSFTNTAFWGENEPGEENKVAMNALRSINFSVNNFKGTDDDRVVSSVRTKYVLSFSAPKNFVEQLALQVLTEHSTAMLPQIVVADLIKAGNNSQSYNTANSEDYNSAACTDLTFSVTKSGDNYTATSKSTTITLEAFTKQVEQSLDFRMWDTSKLTNEDNPTLESEGGELLPSLTATYSQGVNYYRITIFTSDFILPAGTPTTVKHIVQLAPTNALDDEHIGGTFVTLQKDAEGNITGFEPITEVHGDTTSTPTFTLMRVSESSTGTFYTDSTFATADTTKTAETEDLHVLTGTPVTYTVNGVYTSSSKATEQVNETKNYTTDHTYTIIKSQTEGTDTAWNTNGWFWDDTPRTGFKVQDGFTEPDNSNYKNSDTQGYIGVTNRVGSSYTTEFYIYKIPVTRTGTVTVTEISEERTVSKRTTTDRTKDVTETKTVTNETKSENGTTETITMNVVRATKTTDIGKETVTKTTTVTTTYTRTYTETGFIYRAYYNDSTYDFQYYQGDDLNYQENEGGISYKEGISEDDKIHQSVYSDTETYKFSSEKLIGQKGVDYTSIYTDDDTTRTITNTSTDSTIYEDQEFSEVTTKTEYVQRTITRNYTFTDVSLTKVTWCKRDPTTGKPVYENNVLQTEDFTSAKKLNLYDGNIQKLYLAQCYSKTYPFFVDVQFEQIQ